MLWVAFIYMTISTNRDFVVYRPKWYLEESQEAELEVRGTKELYDKIDMYRKGEFRTTTITRHLNIIQRIRK